MQSSVGAFRNDEAELVDHEEFLLRMKAKGCNDDEAEEHWENGTDTEGRTFLKGRDAQRDGLEVVVVPLMPRVGMRQALDRVTTTGRGIKEVTSRGAERAVVDGSGMLHRSLQFTSADLELALQDAPNVTSLQAAQGEAYTCYF